MLGMLVERRGGHSLSTLVPFLVETFFFVGGIFTKYSLNAAPKKYVSLSLLLIFQSFSHFFRYFNDSMNFPKRRFPTGPSPRSQ